MIKKCLFLSTLIVAFSLQSFGSTFNTTVSFGTAPTCMGKGICSANVQNTIPVTFSYDAGTNILTISFLDADLVKVEPGLEPTFQGQPTYSFDFQWSAPDNINNALGTPKPVVIKAGMAFPLSYNATNGMRAITVDLNK